MVVATTRRAWSRDDKRAILAEAQDPATTVSAVARRHGLHPSLLFRWRRDAWDKERAAAAPPQPAFVPLALPLPVGPPRASTRPASSRSSSPAATAYAPTRPSTPPCCGA